MERTYALARRSSILAGDSEVVGAAIAGIILSITVMKVTRTEVGI
jgi:hypothetical protein